jgi:hypothetical protein
MRSSYPVIISSRECIIHQSPSDLQPLDRDGWRVGRQVSHPLFTNGIRPARFDKAVHCDLDNDIPEVKGI